MTYGASIWRQASNTTYQETGEVREERSQKNNRRNIVYKERAIKNIPVNTNSGEINNQEDQESHCHSGKPHGPTNKRGHKL